MTYTVSFYLRKISDSFFQPNNDTQFFFETNDLNLANTLVDEIVSFRKTGKKSAMMLSLESENYATFRKEASSAVIVEEHYSKRIRFEGHPF